MVYAIVLPLLVAVAFLLGALLFAVWWGIRLALGTPFRPVYLGLATAGYLALFWMFEVSTWGELGYVSLAAVVLLVASAAVMFLHTYGTIRTSRDSSGEARYTASPVLAAIWLILFLLEIYVQVELLGAVEFGGLVSISGFPAPALAATTAISDPAYLVLTIVGSVFAVSTGLLIGHYIAVGTAFGAQSRRSAGRSSHPAPSSRSSSPED